MTCFRLVTQGYNAGKKINKNETCRTVYFNLCLFKNRRLLRQPSAFYEELLFIKEVNCSCLKECICVLSFDVVCVCVDDTDDRLESCTVNPMERVSVGVLTMNTLL